MFGIHVELMEMALGRDGEKILKITLHRISCFLFISFSFSSMSFLNYQFNSSYFLMTFFFLCGELVASSVNLFTCCVYEFQDIVSEHPERFFVGEIIREKIFIQYRNEVPYACQVCNLTFQHWLVFVEFNAFLNFCIL